MFDHYETTPDSALKNADPSKGREEKGQPINRPEIEMPKPSIALNVIPDEMPGKDGIKND